jgi:hypothetical protein
MQTDENGQHGKTCFKTVGGVYHRYRLVHRWVPETVLNVQSESLMEGCSSISRALRNLFLKNNKTE